MPAPALSLDALRARIRGLERLSPPPAEPLPVFPEVDAALPWRGLPLACLHQILAADEAGTAFAALLAGRLARRLERPVLWVAAGDDLHAPGLAGWGLDSARLLVARPRDGADALWCMEEGLKCPDLACVVGEVAALDLTAGRRLQLACEAGGVTGLALHPPLARAANAGTTRWRAASAPAGAWRLQLERCRNGLPGNWLVKPETGSNGV